MKPVVCFALFLSGALLFAGTTREGEGEKLLRQRSEALSARLLIREWQETFARDAFPEGEDAMREAMLRDPGANSTVSAARANCRRQLETSLRAAYRREAGKRIAPFAAALPESERNLLTQGRADFFKKRTDALFDPSFQRARKAVTAEQSSRIFRQIYPTAEELERLDDAKLAAALETRFRQGLKEPLYEENAALLRRDWIAPAIAAGRAQQALQLRLAQTAEVPGDLWDAAPVEAFLVRFVEDGMAREVPDAARRYPLFRATQKQIAERANALPVRRVSVRFAAFPAEKYDAMLRAKPEEHKSLKQSAETVASAWAKEWKNNALRLAEPPEAWRSRLAEDPALQQAAEAHLRQFAPKMVPLRTAFAKEQLKQFWPELADGSWLPEAAAVERYAAGDRKALPDGLPRVSAAGLLEEAAAQEAQFLRETLEREVKRLEVQRVAVGAVYNAVLAEMGDRQQANQQKGDSWIRRLFGIGKIANVQLEEVEKCYRTEVEERSSKPLFPSMEEEIRVRSRAILAQILTPEPQPKTPEKDPEPKEEPLTVELILSGAEGALELRMDGWNHPCQNVGEAVRASAEELKRRIGKQEEGKERQVTIRITVAGDRIYYCSVAELRDALTEAIPGSTVEDSLPKAK